jgi:hypothetical protein
MREITPLAARMQQVKDCVEYESKIVVAFPLPIKMNFYNFPLGLGKVASIADHSRLDFRVESNFQSTAFSPFSGTVDFRMENLQPLNQDSF